ncbi:patatin-like phospholipase family protein [Candidatus Uhrbacteria bacterium]|nr:patatin-like phospholipase family protein [Candidatus Uhrbacteria bacterium]
MPQKFATLLSGGLMRGSFQGGACYAIEELEENGGVARGDTVAGSVGVCNGIFRATRSVRRSSLIWRDCVHGRQLIYWKWGRPRMHTRHLLECFRRYLPAEQLGRHGKFIAVLTDLETGMPVYLEIGPASPIWRIVLASIAIPPLVEPVRIEERFFADGGLSDPLPIRFLIEQGYTEITVILNRPLSYRDDPGFNRAVSSFILRSFPEARRAFVESAARCNQDLELLQNPPSGIKVRVIAPPENPISRLCRAREELLRFWRCGYAEAYRAFGKIPPPPPF